MDTASKEITVTDVGGRAWPNITITGLAKSNYVAREYAVSVTGREDFVVHDARPVVINGKNFKFRYSLESVSDEEAAGWIING